MILLDTHIWIWWVDGSLRLSSRQQELIEQYQAQGLGVSIISCWEVAKLVEKNKLALGCTVEEWLDAAIAYPGIQLLDLTLPIILRSTSLENFHRDPGDQMIVATAIIQNCPLLTADRKILDYVGVTTLD
jgi:PIN domain nuclease of toxin-antitoxin system